MIYNLSEVLEEKGYIRGPFGSALKRGEMKDSGIPVYEQQNAIYDNREFRYFIDKEKYNDLKRFTVQTDDLIISCSGTVGCVSLIKENDAKGIISQALLILRPNKQLILPEFLKYYFLSKEGKSNLIERSIGSVQVNLAKRKYIESIEINVPPLKEQKKVVYYLDLLTRKINLNNEIKKNIEELSQNLYKQWFIDFEFPNEEGLPYKSSGGKMLESELGEIPDGWSIKKLEEIYINHDSKRKPLSKLEREKREKIYPYYGAISLVDYVDDYIYEGNYILLSEDGANVLTPNGSPSLQYVWGKFWVNNHAHVMTGKEIVSTEFLYYLLKQLNFTSIVTGAVQPKISQKNLNSFKIIVPSKVLINEYDEIIQPMFKNIVELSNEIETLKKLRNFLLPKLLSGEIEIPDESAVVSYV